MILLFYLSNTVHTYTTIFFLNPYTYTIIPINRQNFEFRNTHTDLKNII